MVDRGESAATAGTARACAVYALASNAFPAGGSSRSSGVIRAVVDGALEGARATVEIDGPVTDAEWRRDRDAILPDGLFVAVDTASSTWVGTIGAIHNPTASRFYFPGGGELGYLVVAPDHRRRGLGAALIAAAIRRLRQGGYRHIFLGVEASRLPAVRSHLQVGFQPFLHAPGLAERWQSVFAALGREPRESEWPTSLPGK
jgi:GNAT superfamily N-acetyltransferase